MPTPTFISFPGRPDERCSFLSDVSAGQVASACVEPPTAHVSTVDGLVFPACTAHAAWARTARPEWTVVSV